MINDIKISTINTYPYRRVILNGQKAQRITDRNSPTGRSGNVRTTFITDDYVIKFGGIGESYVTIEEQDKPYFAEVVLVDIQREWIIQRRVDCVPNVGIGLEDWNAILEMCQKYDIGDVCYSMRDGEYERTPHNWTVNIYGQPVIFDYDFNVHTNNSFASWQLLSCDEDWDGSPLIHEDTEDLVENWLAVNSEEEEV